MEQDIFVETIQFHNSEKGPIHIEVQNNIDFVLDPNEVKLFEKLSEKLKISRNELIEGRLRYILQNTKMFDLDFFLLGHNP